MNRITYLMNLMMSEQYSEKNNILLSVSQVLKSIKCQNINDNNTNDALPVFVYIKYLIYLA